MYASLAFAANIKQVKAYGETGYDGFVKNSDDYLTFEADIATPELIEVTTDEVVLTFSGLSSSVKFSDPFCSYSSCTLLPQTPVDPHTYNCICKTTWSLSGQDRLDLSVSYESSSLPTVVYKDSSPPTISSASFSQKDGKLRLNYVVTDNACSGCSGKCIGVKGIRIVDEKGWTGTVDINKLPTDPCSTSNYYDFDYSEIGLQKFTIKLMDNYWQGFEDDTLHSDSNTVQFTTDFSEPSVDSTFSYNIDGKEINHLSYNTKTADLSILITEDYLKKATLLSAYGNNEVSVTDCKETDKVHNCTFKNIKIKLIPPETTATFELTVEDNQNNLNTVAISKTFTMDNESPEVTFIGGEYLDPLIGKSFVKKENTKIVMSLTETGSGFNTNQVFMNLNALTGKSSVQATNCIDGWVCYWNISSVTTSVPSGSSIPISRTSPSTDDAGNSLTGIESGFVMYDNVKPIINNVSVLSVTQLGLIPFHASGDVLSITLNASDEHSRIQKAVANFTNLYGFEDNTVEEVSALCERFEKSTLCTWETNAITSGRKDVKVPIIVTDFAGNDATEYVEKIAIYNPHDSVPDCYELKYGTILPVEYNTMNSFPLGMYYYQTIPLELKTKGCGGDLFNLELTGACGGGGSVYTVKNGKDYAGFIQFPIDPAMIVRNYEDSQTENVFTVGTDEASSCALIFYVTGKKNLYTSPELENVSISIPIVNELLPAGTEMKNEIDDVLKSYNDYGKILVDAEKVMDLARNICNVRNVFTSISTVFSAVQAVWEVLVDTPVTKTAATPAAKASGIIWKVVKGARAVLDSKAFLYFCALITCDNKQQKGEYDDDGNYNVGTEDVGEGVGGGFSLPGGFLPIIYDTAQKLLKPLFGNVEGLNTNDPGQTFDSSFPASPMELAKSNIVIAVAGLCLPAVIYHLNKRMQLECWRGQCYMTLVPAGIPKKECDQQYNYQKCVYYNNWISVLLKWIGIDALGQAINNIIENPTTLIWGLTKKLLGKACDKTSGTGSVGYYLSCLPYTLMDLAEKSMTALSTVKGFIAGFDWDNIGQPDYCGQLEEMVTTDETWNGETEGGGEDITENTLY